MSAQDLIRQRLLESIYGLLPDEDSASLRRQIESDPELARAEAEMRAMAALLAEAARREAPAIALVPPGEAPPAPAETQTASASKGRGWSRIFTAAAAVLVAVVGGGQWWLAGEAERIASDRTRLTMVGPSTIAPGESNRYTVRVETADGLPRQQPVEVNLFDSMGRSQYKLAGTPDASGTWQFQLPGDAVPAIGRVDVAVQFDSYQESISAPWSTQPAVWFDWLATDRTVYLPGETVRFRDVRLRRNDLRPAEAELREATVVGPDGLPLEGAAVRGTSEAGVYADEVVLPADLNAGRYGLVSTGAGQDDPGAMRVFDVEDLTTPSVTAELLVLRAADSQAEGRALLELRKQPANEPLVGAEITLDDSANGVQVVDKKAAVTNEAGQVEFGYFFAPELSESDARLAVNVAEGGETLQFFKSLPFDRSLVRLGIAPEGGDLVAGLSNRVYVQSETAGGVPAPVLGKVIDTNKGDEVARFATDAEGRGQFTFVPSADGNYVVEYSQTNNVVAAFGAAPGSPAMGDAQEGTGRQDAAANSALFAGSPPSDGFDAERVSKAGLGPVSGEGGAERADSLETGQKLPLKPGSGGGPGGAGAGDPASPADGRPGPTMPAGRGRAIASQPGGSPPADETAIEQMRGRTQAPTGLPAENAEGEERIAAFAEADVQRSEEVAYRYRAALPPVDATADFQFSIDTAVVGEREPIKAVIQSKREAASLIVLADSPGANVAFPVQVKLGANEVPIDLPDEAGGVVRVTLFDAAAVPPVPVAERLAFRKPVRRLSVKWSPDPATVYPGASVDLAFEVRDEEGNPARGAVLGVAVVREDVLRPLSSRPQPTMTSYWAASWDAGKPTPMELLDFPPPEDANGARALDHLLATRGWRRITQTAIAAPQPAGLTGREAAWGAEQPVVAPVVADNSAGLREEVELEANAVDLRWRPWITRLGLAGGGLIGLAVLVMASLHRARGVSRWAPALAASVAAMALGGLALRDGASEVPAPVSLASSGDRSKESDFDDLNAPFEKEYSKASPVVDATEAAPAQSMAGPEPSLRFDPAQTPAGGFGGAQRQGGQLAESPAPRQVEEMGPMQEALGGAAPGSNPRGASIGQSQTDFVRALGRLEQLSDLGGDDAATDKYTQARTQLERLRLPVREQEEAGVLESRGQAGASGLEGLSRDRMDAEKSPRFVREYAYDGSGDGLWGAMPPVLVWRPLVRTDETGAAQVHFVAPTVPGVYRVMVDAHAVPQAREPGRIGSVQFELKIEAPPAMPAAAEPPP
jgi:hypothetical protein